MEWSHGHQVFEVKGSAQALRYYLHQKFITVKEENVQKCAGRHVFLVCVYGLKGNSLLYESPVGTSHFTLHT